MTAAAGFVTEDTMKKIVGGILGILIALFLSLQGIELYGGTADSISLDQIPEFSGTPYVQVEGNVPEFSDSELGTQGWESYSELDMLGRCGPAFAVVGLETMPTEERGSIGQVKPTGWQMAKYDCVEGKYLYNRCHLIGYQLTAENANAQNLITGTRYMNVDGMLPFENEVADYVTDTGNHVAYRVTPVFQDSELVARGVQMEAQSVEDDGEGICFNVYVYNNQPGVVIDYATGESWLDQSSSEYVTDSSVQETVYILNTNSGRFHLPDCSGAANMSEKNKQVMPLSRADMIAQGYTPCSQCKP